MDSHAVITTAWDPGDTTGYAVWDADYNLVEMGQCSMENIPKTWEAIETVFGKIGVAVVEDFVLFGHRAKQQSGSRMKASQGIGMIKALARTAEVVMQPANIKDLAKKKFQVSVPSNHAESHRYDAFMHGAHYLHQKGKIMTPLEKMKEIERDRAKQ